MRFKPAQIRSKAAGRARQARAILGGRRGIFATLEREHAELSSLLAAVARTRETAAGHEQRRLLFPIIRRELLAHARAEASELYPVLAAYALTYRDAARAATEHEEIERLLILLDGLDDRSAEWMSSFVELRRAIQAHIDEEERALLPRAQMVIDDSQARQIDGRFQEVRAREARRIDGEPLRPEPRDSPPPLH